MNERVVGGVKGYLLIRWKKRWPVVPVSTFFIAFWAITADQYKVHQQLHTTVVGAVIFIMVGILFPFRWRGENWEKPKTR